MGMLLLAELPPLYFRVMDPLLLAQAGGDFGRINVDPRRRTTLASRYALGTSSPK